MLGIIDKHKVTSSLAKTLSQKTDYDEITIIRPLNNGHGITPVSIDEVRTYVESNYSDHDNVSIAVEYNDVDNNGSLSYYTPAQAFKDADRATNLCIKKNINSNSGVYFAINVPINTDNKAQIQLYCSALDQAFSWGAEQGYISSKNNIKVIKSFTTLMSSSNVIVRGKDKYGFPSEYDGRTMNPDLDTAMPVNYGLQNYELIQHFAQRLTKNSQLFNHVESALSTYYKGYDSVNSSATQIRESIGYSYTFDSQGITAKFEDTLHPNNSNPFIGTYYGLSNDNVSPTQIEGLIGNTSLSSDLDLDKGVTLTEGFDKSLGDNAKVSYGLVLNPPSTVGIEVNVSKTFELPNGKDTVSITAEVSTDLRERQDQEAYDTIASTVKQMNTVSSSQVNALLNSLTSPFNNSYNFNKSWVPVSFSNYSPVLDIDTSLAGANTITSDFAKVSHKTITNNELEKEKAKADTVSAVGRIILIDGSALVVTSAIIGVLVLGAPIGA